ncbi:Photosynthetic NDH subunit of subcomplex B 3, chloroplastic [Linum grandiflorum]
MSATHFPGSTPISDCFARRRNQSVKKKYCLQSKRKLSSVSATAADQSQTVPAEKPVIELQFIAPKTAAVEEARAISGDKLLRSIMLDNKIELYAAYIVEGSDLLNERTNAEFRYLKKKPESWRLACQTIVGNKENSGKVVVQRLPQWKK